jgi:hypothetical protein
VSLCGKKTSINHKARPADARLNDAVGQASRTGVTE